MKRFLIFFVLFLIIPTTCYAQEEFSKEKYSEYISQYDLTSFQDNLDEDTYSVLESLGLSDFDFENITNLTIQDVINVVKKYISGKIQTPLSSTVVVLVFIVLSAFFQSFKIDDDSGLSQVYSTASSLIIAVILVVKISSTITLSSAAIEVAGDFIVAFIPTFCAIVATSGGITTSFSTNSMLLLLSQGLSFISSNIFMPLINCFLAVGICCGIRSTFNLGQLVSTMKKIITGSISILSAAFVSILSIKTSISSRADILGIRSIRFVINSVVPVIGSTISEGLLSIQSYSSLIKSSVGIVGIIAIALVFLPSIIEVMLWRFMLSVCLIISGVFGDNSVTLVLKAFKDTMLLVNVVLVLSMMTSVVSFGILIAAKSA
jgi:stage III sporulation protein AE